MIIKLIHLGFDMLLSNSSLFYNDHSNTNDPYYFRGLFNSHLNFLFQIFIDIIFIYVQLIKNFCNFSRIMKLYFA
jgi:hypothetical protein